MRIEKLQSCCGRILDNRLFGLVCGACLLLHAFVYRVLVSHILGAHLLHVLEPISRRWLKKGIYGKAFMII